MLILVRITRYGFKTLCKVDCFETAVSKVGANVGVSYVNKPANTIHGEDGFTYTVRYS